MGYPHLPQKTELQFFFLQICIFVPTQTYSNFYHNKKDLNNSLLRWELPSPEIIRTSISRIIKAFEDTIQTELIKVRWGRDKKATNSTSFRILMMDKVRTFYAQIS